MVSFSHVVIIIIIEGSISGHQVRFDYSIIHQVDGKVLVRYKHPGPVFGCDWHPSNK